MDRRCPMTEEELEQLIEQKKAQAKVIKFDRTEDEFMEDLIKKILNILDHKSKQQKTD